MSDTNNSASKTPTHVAYQVRDREGKKAFWTRIGAAWQHADGTVHEFAHELLHRGDDRPKSKTVRETEAEAVAFVVCQAIGLQNGTSASDYIQLYDGETETLAASLDRIQKTAAEIIAAIYAPNEQAHAA